MHFTAIIPLRAGSKRIPQKNIKILGNKPLFCHTLDEALKSINKIIISTDDKKVITILNNNYNKEIYSGKIIIINRDDNISKDDTSTVDVILDVINQVKDIENIILLQATSPFRKCKHIDKAILLYKNNIGKSVISVHQTNEPAYWQQKINNKGCLISVLGDKYLKNRSQDLERLYMLNGAIYIISKKLLIKNGSLIIANKSIPYIMDKKYSLDIDTEDDFNEASYQINKFNEKK